jgi:hypothetical protein
MVDPIVCATFLHSHSAPKPTELTFAIPPMTSSSPLVACTDYLHVQKPIKTYSILSTATLKYYQIQSSPFLLGELTKMLVAENLEVSGFKVLP